MSKELRMRDYERKAEKKQGKTNKYFQAQEDYEIYVAPIKNMGVKEFEYFMNQKFERLTERKPNLHNKLVK